MWNETMPATRDGLASVSLGSTKKIGLMESELGVGEIVAGIATQAAALLAGRAGADRPE
jgi:hypothetical protein